MPPVELVSVNEMIRDFAAGVVSVPAVVQVPAKRPAEFLRVWRTGGGPINRVLDEAIITAQGWALSAARAEEIVVPFRDALLNDYTLMPLVRSVEIISGPYMDPDPDSKSPRQTITARLRIRGRRR